MSSVADIDGYFAEPEIIQICVSKQPFRVKPFKNFRYLKADSERKIVGGESEDRVVVLRDVVTAAMLQ